MVMLATSWRVGRIAGIEVRVDSSWVAIALLITYSMYLRLAVLYPELSAAAPPGWPSCRRCCSLGRSWSMSWPTPWSPRPGGSGPDITPCF
jgi:hypothetical protein